MDHWRLRLRYFWRDHRVVIVLLAMGVAIVTAIETLMLLSYGSGLSFRPAAGVPAEATIVGFVGGDTRFSTGVTALIRTPDNGYHMVGLPYGSGCRRGDRVFLTQWVVGGRTRYMQRPPGCVRWSGAKARRPAVPSAARAFHETQERR